MAEIVALRGVSKSFPATDGGEPVEVLSGVDLSIGPTEKASLVGPSGSGKSTLLALVAGLLYPNEGTVIIDGVPISELDDRDRSRLRADTIGIALQQDNLIPFLTARENVELACGMGHRHRARAGARAVELLQRFGVLHQADRLPRQLSGGEAQRVALAVAMANEPSLLLADEVVAQLDEETAGQVVAEVLDGELAVLYVTHHMELADRVHSRYQLEHRRVVAR